MDFQSSLSHRALRLKFRLARSASERDSQWSKGWIMSGHFCNISLMRPTPLWFISNYIWLRLLSNCLVVAWPRLALLIMYAKIVSCSICPGNANQSANVGVHRILPHWMKPHPLAHLGVAKTHIPARFLRCSSWKFYIGSLVAKHSICAHVHVMWEYGTLFCQ